MFVWCACCGFVFVRLEKCCSWQKVEDDGTCVCVGDVFTVIDRVSVVVNKVDVLM